METATPAEPTPPGIGQAVGLQTRHDVAEFMARLNVPPLIAGNVPPVPDS